MQKPSDQKLLDLILELEDKLWAEGLDPRRRVENIPTRAMHRLGYSTYALSGPHMPEPLCRIKTIHRTLYRTKDIAFGGVHGGAFMFRGIAVGVHIPLVVGSLRSVKINPFDYSDLVPRQIEWLQSDPEHVGAYLSTFSDLYDFAGCLIGFDGCRLPPEPARRWFIGAAFQIQAAGATLCSAFDGRGAIQSSLLGVEFSLKGALASKGKSDADLKDYYGHDLSHLVKDIGGLYNTFELDSVEARMRMLPELVPNRYSPEQPSRVKTGNIVMASQYIAGAVARAVSGGSFGRHVCESESQAISDNENALG